MDTSDPASRARLLEPRGLAGNFLVLTGLSALAIAQPLLDIYGQNPAAFVANRMTSWEVVLFALMVVFVPPVLCLGIEVVAYLIDHRVGRVVHLGLVGGLAALLGLGLAQDLGFDATVVALALALAAALAVGVVLLLLRTAWARRWLAYLSGAAVLFLLLFLFASPTSGLIWGDEAVALDGVRVADPAPVVMLVFDELPVSTLMTDDGEINADLFPNFARLAGESTWYRNATSNGANTALSVPTAMSGVLADIEGIPTSVDYPDNLFTVLGGVYEVQAQESVTALCPDSVCAAVEGAEADSTSDFRGTLRDAGVVYRHLIYPEGWRAELPPVDQGWGAFGQEAVTLGPVESPNPSDSAGREAPTIELGTYDERAAVYERLADSIDGEADLTFWYGHAAMPHHPWVTTQDGVLYSTAGGTAGAVDGSWPNEEVARQAFQRHLLQTGRADELLGEVLDSLEEQGLWDDAMVVVIGDHGIAFEPGEALRRPTATTATEVYRVPLFVKAPGQSEGVIDDQNAMLVDLLPTLMEILGVETPDEIEFDGRSLISDPAPDEKPVVYGSGPETLAVTLDDLFGVVGRNARYVPDATGWDGVMAVGEDASLIGAAETDLGSVAHDGLTASIDQDLSAVDPSSGFIPILISGTASRSDGSRLPPEFLVVVNGEVAGVAVPYPADERPGAFSALIGQRYLVEGANEVTLLIRAEGGWLAVEASQSTVG